MANGELLLGAQAYECRLADTCETHDSNENVIRPISEVSQWDKAK